MARKPANKSFIAPGWSRAQAATLDAVLAAKAGDGGPMGYCEMAGFLFAVACAPELVRPSEWLPEILGESMETFGSLEEVQDTMNLVMGLNWGATIILSGRTTTMMAGGEESKAA